MARPIAPITAAMVTPAYVPNITYTGGVTGSDPGENSAPVTPVSTAASTDAYSPRSQNAKAVALGVGIANDVTRPQGPVGPRDPYPAAGDIALLTPVVTSLSPATAPQAQLPLSVTITGTGFTRYSRVYTGGSNLPDGSAQFVNATTMRVPIWKAAAGTVSVSVEDHEAMSNTDKVFTVT